MIQKKANSKDRTLTNGSHGWEWGMVWYQRHRTVLLNGKLYSSAEEVETYHIGNIPHNIESCLNLFSLTSKRKFIHEILIIISYNAWRHYTKRVKTTRF